MFFSIDFLANLYGLVYNIYRRNFAVCKIAVRAVERDSERVTRKT